MAKTIAIIPARFGSRRFPGKPLALIAGKSLIQRSYENARRCQLLDAVVIATDDASIQQHAHDFGAEVVMTSPGCLTGTDRVAEALALLSKDPLFDIVVNIQGDEPFLDPYAIEKVIHLLHTHSDASMSTIVTKLTSAEDASNPSIVKCVCSFNGYALYFSRGLLPAGPFRADVNYYRHLGIYGFRREFLPIFRSLPPTPLQLAEDLEQLKVLENGHRIATAVVEDQGLGVDNPHDIPMAAQWLKTRETIA